MKYHIAIFAGGLGSRLNKTESKPKPLVEINGLSMLSRIIISFQKTGLFKCFHILTCCDNGLFKDTLLKEIKSINFVVHNQINRDGRIGALKNFLNSQKFADKFFVCNGDTIFNNLIASEIENPLNKFDFKPITYLALPDKTRTDYKALTINSKTNNLELQNSGLFFMCRSWLFYAIKQYPNAKDIDELLFSCEGSSKLSLLSTSLFDAGTPERLSFIRSFIN